MNELSVPGQTPPAMVHKRILDRAKTEPEASIKDLANDISGASVELVERVLSEYGDPASSTENADDPDDRLTGSNVNVNSPDDDEEKRVEKLPSDGDERGPDGDIRPTEDFDLEDGESHENGSTVGTSDISSLETEGETNAGTELRVFSELPEPDELTDKQWEALKAIHTNPDATQAELAESIGVSPATVCNRVNAVPGFQWRFREQFVKELLDRQIEDATPLESSDTERIDSATEWTGTAVDGSTEKSTMTDTDVGASEDREANGAALGDVRGDELANTVEELSKQVTAALDRINDMEATLMSMEKRNDVGTRGSENGLLVEDPKLIQKLVSVTFQSDEFSDEEELKLIKDLVGR